MRVGNDAAIGNDRLPQGGSVDFAAGQKARMGVDCGLWIKEAVFGSDIGKIEIRFVKSADCSDVFPVTFKNVGAHVPLLDRLWNDMLAEIGQVIIQAFHQHGAVEDVNSHRRLEQFLSFVQTDRGEQFTADFHLVKHSLLRRFL